jgi:DNA-binding HxlR family transcriptional regulator
MITPPTCVKSTFHDDRIWTDLADGGKMVARANVCATGVEWRHLNLPDEDRLLGRGLYYGAGASEAPLCGGEDVYVVGGGNSAGQAVMHLAKHARSVTMLVRDTTLAASMSQYLSDRILGAANVQVQYDVEITGLGGEHALERIRIGSRTTKEANWAVTPRLFVAIGGVPNTEWAADTAPSSAIKAVTSLPVLTSLPTASPQSPGRWSVRPTTWRPPSRASSPPGMCATAQSSALPPQQAKARWPSPSFTDTWKKQHEQSRLRRGSVAPEGLMSADAQRNVLDVRFPTRRILAIIGDKWTTVVLYCLSIREHRRFNELQKQIPDISKKMLIQTLRNLERDGLLERTIYQQVPPKTEYRLTDNGHKLREPIAWLCKWGMNNQELIDGIIKARAEAVLTGDAHKP